ncbi:beta-lactamase hydrolase domain-containing protein [Solimonas variicoloris]|uniref:beta-lactamase hydrolase domain-containing protein n=1 Tax=Solimonas variicoloris TaxID=254408 RepID=UPI00038233FB|nr:protein tyrosine phosphatase family protein [Solimonas variicoloris]
MKNLRKSAWCWTLGAALVAGGAHAADATVSVAPVTAAQGVSMPALPKLQQPAPRLWISGQPAPAQFEQLPASGIRRVINLRPAGETPDFDEAGAAQRLGLVYRSLPIAGADDLSLVNVRALDALLAEAPDTPTLLHCASGNRVGALMGLRAAWLQGRPVSDALAIGRAHGLASLEPVVAQLLARGIQTAP